MELQSALIREHSAKNAHKVFDVYRDSQTQIKDLIEAFENKAADAAAVAESKLRLAESNAKNNLVGQGLAQYFRNDAASARLSSELAAARSELAARDEAVEVSLTLYREEAGVEILQALKI